MIEVMTTGYEGMELAAFLALLKRCGVTTLVDVRELPISRKRGFAKAALREELANHQIDYLHLPALGCPRDIRHEYRADGDWQRYTVRFRAYLNTQDETILSLLDLCSKAKCCLLCFEADFNFCHRTYVAERAAELAGDSFQIRHLTGPVQGRVVSRNLAAA